MIKLDELTQEWSKKVAWLSLAITFAAAWIHTSGDIISGAKIRPH